MKQFTQTTKYYFTTYKKLLATIAIVLLALAVIITGIVLLIKNSATKVVYQPANACDLFTPDEARELLGNKSIHSGVETPALQGNTATSKCGYTDGNPDMNNAVVAAVVVRSGVNDKGVEQNQKEFDAGKPTKNVEDIKNLGDKAYFNRDNGQLNVLKGHDWILFSYGVGAAPSTNTLEDAMKLADKVLQKSV
jgi:hypothetical protein